ncbi:hypothetical protein L5515_006620 [Caenorhabditis briggsae]|uniref:Uncharacterized protein n=1 Tax=Caenorhabditis briggsae TaxID=6238 RepID=A0AAE9F2S0_CAEBR|nr:hypothetical protein L5515_006620 [Caenorhabditis briggsae]
MSPNLCRVCGEKSHGTHFGATTCRACAVFYRRIGARENTFLKCRTGVGICKIQRCKKCRLEKCKEVGMSNKNFQFNRDRIKTSEFFTPSIEMFVGRPDFLLFCDPERPKPTPNFVDLSNLLEKAKLILQYHQNFVDRNRLQKMSRFMNLGEFRELKSYDYNKITTVGIRESFIIWENDLLSVARWLTYFGEFQELGLSVKLKFLKTIWHIWNRLKSLVRSAAYLRSQKLTDPTCIYMTHDISLDLKTVKLNVEWITEYSVEQIAYFIECSENLSIFTTIPLILDLNPTDVEFNYMLAQLSFSFAAKRLGGEYAEVSENLLKTVADDLHDYYTQIGHPRYSDRVVKMMKVNNSLFGVLREKREKLEIAKTFDIFNVQFSEPEMVQDIF